MPTFIVRLCARTTPWLLMGATACLLVLLSVELRRADATGGLTALDGEWVLKTLSINGQAAAAPAGTEYRYTVTTASGYMKKRWVSIGGSYEHGEGRLESSSVQYRGSSSWTQTDRDQMIAAGLDPTTQDAVIEMDAAPGVTAKLAARVYEVTGGYECALTTIHQSAPWTIPTAIAYAPQAVGSSTSLAAWSPPAGARTLTSMVWQK